MNAEVIKAMNKQETRMEKISKWWHKNSFKIFRVILFPIYFGGRAYDKYAAIIDARQTWDKQRAAEILSYYIPRVATWDEEKKEFYFFDNGMGWRMKHLIKKIKMKDRRFWKVNGNWYGKIVRYLIDEFELEGFTKEIGDCEAGRTELTFHLINKLT